MERISCNCQLCKDCCEHKPGWLQFGDEKKISAKLGISVKELFDRFLIIDWIDVAGKTIFILSPCATHLKPGSIMPSIPLGICAFLNEKRECTIHEVAPLECQLTFHDMSDKEAQKNHFDIAYTWDNEEAQSLIRELYGKVPVYTQEIIFEHLEFNIQRAKAGLSMLPVDSQPPLQSWPQKNIFG
jgi:Fe-S-cluster containining protein